MGDIVVKTQEEQALEIISNAASNPDVDVQKMQQLLDMREHIMDKQAEKDYMQAMQMVQQEMPAIYKKCVNTQTNSKYAKLEHINNILVPVYTKHGFSVTFGSKSAADGFICVTAKIFHVGGHYENAELTIAIDDEGIKGSKNKTSVHGSGSAVSYCRRYLTTMIFNVVLTDEDDDGNAAGSPRQQQNQAQSDQARLALLEATHALRESIAAIKQGIESGDLPMAAEAWFELTEDEMRAIWVAPSKFPDIAPFTTEERAVIKGDLQQFNPKRAQNV